MMKRRRNTSNTNKIKTLRSNSKRSKVEVEENIKTGSSIKIDDVNLDCLEHVFRLLDLKDLINVAEANKQLNAAAGLAFNHKYGKLYVLLRNEKPKQGPPVEIYEDRNFISVNNRKFTFKILRLFGHYISEVSIDALYPDANRARVNYDRIVQYVNEYCLESLTSFRVLRHPKNVLNALKKEFKNVEDVRMSGGRIQSEILFQINQWFPNMRRLKLHPIRFPDLKSIKFEHLEDLSMGIFPIDKKKIYVDAL